MKQGAMAVTVAPGQLAAKQADVWANNTVAAKAKFARNSAAVSLQDWQTAYTTTGLDRIASGVAKGQSKVTAFMNQFLPFVTNAVKQLPPRGTFEQNIARNNQMIRATHAFSYNKQSS